MSSIIPRHLPFFFTKAEEAAFYYISADNNSSTAYLKRFFAAVATDATGVKFMSCVCCKIWEDVLIFQKAMLRSGKHMFAPLSFMPEQ